MKSGPRELQEYHRKIMEREHKVTNREILEEGVDLNRGAEKVARILGNGSTSAAFAADEKPPKKPRSDKRVPRKPPEPPQAAGKLTKAQAAELTCLIRDAQDAKSEADGAQAKLYNADIKLQRFIDSLAQ
jgi:hypothetical protein